MLFPAVFMRWHTNLANPFFVLQAKPCGVFSASRTSLYPCSELWVFWPEPIPPSRRSSTVFPTPGMVDATEPHTSKASDTSDHILWQLDHPFCSSVVAWQGQREVKWSAQSAFQGKGPKSRQCLVFHGCLGESSGYPRQVRLHVFPTSPGNIACTVVVASREVCYISSGIKTKFTVKYLF